MPKERVQNKAIAHYADFTFSTREAVQDIIFDTSSVGSQILIPTTYWQDQNKTTSEKDRWTFAHFGTKAEFKDLQEAYYRYRVVSHWFNVWDIQIKKIEGQNTTISEQELTNFILETTEFPITFYHDTNYSYGRVGSKITTTALPLQHKARRLRLPIRKKLHFGWKISKEDATDKWWETAELDSEWRTGPMGTNGTYVTPPWNWRDGLRWKYFVRPIPRIFWGLDNRFVQEKFKIHVTYRYETGIKVIAACQAKNFFLTEYQTWFGNATANRKRTHEMIQDDEQPNTDSGDDTTDDEEPYEKACLTWPGKTDEENEHLERRGLWSL